MYTVLVTGVGAIIGYGIARAARASTYPLKVVGMDMKEDAVGQRWCDAFEKTLPADSPDYPRFVQELVQKHKVDLVLPGIEQDVAGMSKALPQFAKLKTRFVLNPTELLTVASDKWLTHQKLVESGFPVIPTRMDGSFEELAKEFGLPFLLKPRRSYASKGIQQIREERDLEYYRGDSRDKLMLQKIVGDDDSEFSVGMFGLGDGTASHLSILQRQLSREGATAKARTVSIPELEKRVQELCKLFRPFGPTNMQFRRHEKEFLLLEINPRFSSSCSLRAAFGFNEVEMCVEYFLEGQKPKPRKLKPGRALRYIEDIVFYEDEDPK